MHRTLVRQLEKFLGKTKEIPQDWQDLLNAVSGTYAHFDEDRALLDRSLSLSSAEFLENSRRLQQAKEKVEEIVKERTQELREAQARLIASIESLSLGFLILDETRQVIYVNSMFGNILNVEKTATLNELEGKLEGKISLKLLFDESRESKKPVVKKNLAFGSKFLHLFVTPITLTETKETVGSVMVVEDATKERQIDKAKSEFVTIASHQLRTPLTIIRWHVEALRKKIQDDKNFENFEKNLLHIDDGTRRMVALVQALLNVSRIEVGKLAIAPTVLDFMELCHNVVDELKPDIQEKNIQLKEIYQPHLSPITADPNLLRIIVQNLLTNALKYTPSGGTVTLALSQEPSKDFLLSVRDTGYGIPLEDQGKIFTKMFRSDNVKLLKVSGTGLGLYITKSIAEAAGGKIWFQSPPQGAKQGTIFYVRLPLKGIGTKEGLSITSNKDDLLYS